MLDRFYWIRNEYLDSQYHNTNTNFKPNPQVSVSMKKEANCQPLELGNVLNERHISPLKFFLPLPVCSNQTKECVDVNRQSWLYNMQWVPHFTCQ